MLLEGILEKIYSQEHAYLFSKQGSCWYAFQTSPRLTGAAYLIWLQVSFLYRFLEFYVKCTGCHITGTTSLCTEISPIPYCYLHLVSHPEEVLNTFPLSKVHKGTCLPVYTTAHTDASSACFWFNR
jgi:hypothetical protein